MVPVHMTNNNENGSRSQAAVVGRHLVLAHGDHVALADASFTLPRGAQTAVIGPNGSGKSTLLHAVAGLLEPVAGDLEVLGRPRLTPDEVAYVPQHLHANRQLPVTVREVVTMGRFAGRGPLGRLRSEDREAVDEAMERLDVARLARRQLRLLSGGERQRALVAQALAQRAPLLLLDEPFTALDLPSQERIRHVVAEEQAHGVTVIATTHALSEAATADHLLLLAGRVVAEGTASEVLSEAHLQAAYGTMVVRVGEVGLLLDDTTHHHEN